jgi:hypothetical protein
VGGVCKSAAAKQKLSIMKSKVSFLIIALFTVLFVGCNDEAEMPGKNLPKASTGAVQVKLEAAASPILKDGDENDPEPMFQITGVITQNGNPVQAEVELMSMPQSTLVDSTNTDSYGGFGFYQVSSGSYNVVVYVDGNVADIIGVNL